MKSGLCMGFMAIQRRSEAVYSGCIKVVLQGLNYLLLVWIAASRRKYRACSDDRALSWS